MTINLGKLIADLLREHNRVSLPGVGAFVGVYQPAILNEETLELTPPFKEISFSKDETWNDELLEQLVSKTEEISIEEAKKRVAEAVTEITAELRKKESYPIAGLGRLLQEDLDITFEIEAGLNLLSEAFGLETINMQVLSLPSDKKKVEAPKAIVAEPSKAKPVEPKPMIATDMPKKKSKTPWILAGLLIVILLLAYVFYNDLFPSKIATTQQTKTEATQIKSDTSNVDQEEDTTTAEDTVEQKVVADKIETQTEKRKALYYEEPKATSESNKTFYIIAGSFNKMQNAEKLKATLVKEGYKPEILTVEGPVFRVSMYSFTNRNRALQELSRLRDQNKERNIWLLGL